MKLFLKIFICALSICLIALFVYACKVYDKTDESIKQADEFISTHSSVTIVEEETVETTCADVPHGELWSDGNVLNAEIGTVIFNGHKETYYSEKVLPGDGLDIPGRHVGENGVIYDIDGYICCACSPSYAPFGTIIETSLGTAKVYDICLDFDGSEVYGIVDIYTSW